MNITSTDQWKTQPISCTCEVSIGPSQQLCEKPTFAAYPAMSGGWMALCHRHAQKHLKHNGAWPTDDLIAKGETWK